MGHSNLIQVPELTFQFVISAVAGSLTIMGLDWSEQWQCPHELSEVDFTVRAVHEEGVNDAVTEWVDGQLRNS